MSPMGLLRGEDPAFLQCALASGQGLLTSLALTPHKQQCRKVGMGTSFLENMETEALKGQVPQPDFRPGLAAKLTVFQPEPSPKSCFANKKTETQRREVQARSSTACQSQRTCQNPGEAEGYCPSGPWSP